MAAGFDLTDPVQRRAYHAQWRAANRDKCKVAAARYVAAHPERETARHARYHAENRAARNAKSAVWYAAHADERRDYEVARRESQRSYQAAWVKANPEKQAARVRKYRARKARAGGEHTAQERAEKFALLGNVCFYCGCGDAPLHEDHDIPLSRGGDDSIRNILPSCKRCNSSKRASTAAEYIRRSRCR